MVTSATFEPTAGAFDELYTGGNGFLDEVGLISDAGPGDRDYNGGRWHLNVLKAGEPCDGTADSVDDLVLGDFASTGTYFECPLLPRKGNNP